eukprot:gene38506-50566_t
MAQLIGGLGTSHIPAIGNAIHKGLQNEPYWKPFFDGFPPIRQWLGEKRPDVVVMFYNDHGLNFFLDKMPTFAVGAAAQYNNADEGWGIPTLPPFPGEVDLSWHLINTLIDQEFDVTTCQEMLVDHACTLPLKLFWPEGDCPVTVVPVCINTVQFPLPSAKRCYALGKAVGQAIQRWDSDKKVAVMASGGLSHQLDGERAGFINKPFDLAFMRSLIDDPTWATRFDTHELVERAGTQGIELLMWLATRAALPGRVTQLHTNYHIPISNTASGLMLFPMPMMKAAVVHEFGRPLEIEEVPVPEVPPGQILVKVVASGVCHTDLHAADGDWPVKPSPPFIPGHEGVGYVAKLGAGVSRIKEGDRVGVPWLHTACGCCSPCRTGWETLCGSQQNTGYSVNGTFAQYGLADPDYVGRLPDNLEFGPAAPVLCAGVTVYKGLKETEVKPGEWVVISGIG